jgi:hypothetical protein
MFESFDPMQAMYVLCLTVSSQYCPFITLLIYDLLLKSFYPPGNQININQRLYPQKLSKDH